MSEKTLLDNIKAVFLCALVILVFIDTVVLAAFVPVVGYYVMPDNSFVTSAWEVVAEAMKGCIVVIIMSIIAYGTVKIIKRGDRVND